MIWAGEGGRGGSLIDSWQIFGCPILQLVPLLATLEMSLFFFPGVNMSNLSLNLTSRTEAFWVILPSTVSPRDGREDGYQLHLGAFSKTCKSDRLVGVSL